ncbi:AraC family transcriptional regulator [Clostridium sp. D2Q-14]|uniref:AraC family transcriptional regulator n=1 Tax=Anaeromonas gelatinilytica TaxID=2683194 RepID=UPI00193C0F17|nr:AraC family transcriptional regulator [Anaeromonas gelatinilytica]MBS4535016.1 AraC family transcriptional regulator [Anaeromonas gelatinilytica]
MKYLAYKENRKHGTMNFPFKLYDVTPLHLRYNMILHWHNEYEIIRVTSGSLLLNIDGNDFNVKAGDIVFLKDGTLHSAIPTKCNYECFLFDMRFLLRKNYICNKEIYNILNHQKNIQLYFSKNDGEAYEILHKIFTDMKNKHKGYQFKIQGYLYYFLGVVKENNYYKNEITIAPKNKRRLSQFKKILAYIELNYSEDISLNDLAKCANMNSRYLCKFFKDMTHKTPIEYLNYYRIECACDQIYITDKNITQIALDCGFNNLSYFIKVFKKFKNMTPNQYSKKTNN